MFPRGSLSKAPSEPTAAAATTSNNSGSGSSGKASASAKVVAPLFKTKRPRPVAKPDDVLPSELRDAPTTVKAAARAKAAAEKAGELLDSELGSDVKQAATLAAKRVSVGMTMLAVVAERSDADVTLHLPHSLRAVVDAANVSDVVVRKYRDALARRAQGDDDQDDDQNDDDDDDLAVELAADEFDADGELVPRVATPRKANNADDLPVLADFVRRDALLPCVVTSVSGKRGIGVSLLASRVNAGLVRELLTVGQALAGAVRSIEDHGYVVDLDLADDSRAFLPRAEDEPVRLRVGEPLLVYVHSVPAGRAPIRLTTDPTTALGDGPAIAIKTLRAGTLVRGRVLSELTNGFSIGFAGYLVGTVELSHMVEASSLRPGSSAKARILFVDQVQKKIALSVLPSVLKATSAAALLKKDAIALSSIVLGTVIERILDAGAVLRIVEAPHRLCYVPRHQLVDAGSSAEGKAYDVNTEHRVRIMAESRLDGSLLGVMRESVLNNPIALISDAKPGMVTVVVVQKVLPRRLQVQLADNVFGVVPLRHMADVVPSNPQTRFKERQLLKCRVMAVDVERRRIKLTAKPSIVDSPLPVIASFADVTPGMLTHGTICRVWPDRGVFVEFCGGIGGLVPMRELSVLPITNAAESFADGQVVRCRVLNARPEDQRLLLTFLTLDESRATRPAANSAGACEALGIRPGAFVSGTVTQATPDFVYVRLDVPRGAASSTVVTGVLHRTQTADVLRGERLPALGAHVADLLVLRTDSARVVLSLKPSLALPARAATLPLSAGDVQVGTVVPGYVASVKSFGVFVAFCGGLSGLAPLFELQDDGQRAPEELFTAGQSVRAYVRSVSADPKHGAALQLSLRPSLCASPAGTFLAALLDARADDAAAPLALATGAVVKATVLARGADGSLKLQLPDGVTGTAAAAQVRDGGKALDDDQERMVDDDTTLRVGDKTKCVVLDVDAAQRTAAVSLRASLLALVSDSKKRAALPAAGATIDGCVVEAVVGDAFAVVSVPAAKTLAFASAQDFNHRAKPALQIGDRVEGVVALAGSRLLVQLPPPAPRAQRQQQKERRQHLSDGAPTLETIKPGTLLDGDVISSGDRYVGVALGGALRGRIYMTEASDDVDDEPALSKLTIGQSLKCKVLYVDTEDVKVKNLVQLTIRASELARGDAAPELPTAATLKPGQLVTARVRQIEMPAQRVLVALTPQLKAVVDFLDCGVHPALIKPGRFRVGVGMRCVVLATGGELPQLALSSGGNSAPAVGALLTGRVLAVEADGSLRVQLPQARVGVVPNAPVLSIGQYVDCKVIGNKSGKPLALVLVDASAALAAASSHESERVVQGAVDALAVGDVVDAVVVSTDETGVQLRIAGGVDAHANMRDVSDDFVTEEALGQLFAPGAAVRARILALNRGASHASLSLKRSTVEGTRFLRFEDLKRSLLVHGRVRSVAEYGLFIALDYSDNLVGLCHARNISDDERFTAEDLRARFKRGDPFHCIVTQVREQERKFAVAIKPSLVGPAVAAARANGESIVQVDDAETAANFVAHDESDDDEADAGAAGAADVDDDAADGDVDEINAKRARHAADDDDDEDDDAPVVTLRTRGSEVKPAKPVKKVSVADLDAMLTRTSTTFDESERQRLLLAAKSTPAAIGVSFDDLDDEPASKKKRSAALVSTADDDDENNGGDGNDDDSSSESGERRKKPRNVQAASLRAEEQVLARERALADDTAAVVTETDHERAVTLEPTSARAWISFMSFHAANDALEAARAVALRALKVIPMSNEAVRLDVWLALLALELNFGTAESLESAFARAVRQNDAESVYLRMATLYEHANRAADSAALLATAVKKFGRSLPVWEALGRVQLVRGDTDGFHATLQRALAELTPRDQLTVVGRFARLEYEFGAVERGRTLFEGVVANHPKRIDQWNIYADMEIKFGDAESARRVFERLAAQPLSSKKMRAALKQWLKFEQQHGTDADAERVRQKAREYVQAQANKVDDEPKSANKKSKK